MTRKNIVLFSINGKVKRKGTVTHRKSKCDQTKFIYRHRDFVAPTQNVMMPKAMKNRPKARPVIAIGNNGLKRMSLRRMSSLYWTIVACDAELTSTGITK